MTLMILQRIFKFTSYPHQEMDANELRLFQHQADTMIVRHAAKNWVNWRSKLYSKLKDCATEVLDLKPDDIPGDQWLGYAKYFCSDDFR